MALMRLPAVLKETGLSRSMVYVEVAHGRFPAPVRISPRCVAWVRAEVMSWIDERINARQAA